MMQKQTKTCEACGREFVRTYTMTRWAERRFCDRFCREAIKRKRPPVMTCTRCGASFKSRSGTGIRNLYCSPACSARSRPVTRPDETGRGRAQAAFPVVQPCSVCGAVGHGRRGTVRHHVNGDRLNNSAENIAWLCRRHHSQAHAKLDGKVGGGPRPRVNALQRERAIGRAIEARRLRDSGLTVEQTAASMGVHPLSVLRWARRYSI